MNTSVLAGARKRLPLIAIVVCASVVPARGQTVPSPWISADVGSPPLAGSATYSSGTFTIDAGGADIWGTSDQFHFVYQPVSGDVDVRARVADLTYASAWSKAGVMIRGSLSAGAAHGYALVSAGKGLAFQRRPQAGALSTNTSGALAAAPQWVRLVRRGTLITAYASATGSGWTVLGSDTIALGTTAYVGIAVTSHNTSMRATADVSNVSVTKLSLPAGQLDADIGSPAVKGSATYSNGTYTVKGAGTDIWGTSDQFNYVYRQMTGDGTVVARVASLTYAAAWTKAGVMIRETLAADSRHAFSLVTAGQGYAFQRRVNTGGLSDHTYGGAGTAAGWLRLVRAGSTFTASRSADGINWTSMGSATITMATTLYVGIAVTSHNPAALATAVVDHFSVAQATASGNQPPLVRLTAPADGSTYVAPAAIGLTASASDPEGQMAAVEFYNGGTLLNRDTTSGYSFSWGSVPAGTYTLTAVAHDAAGNTGTSAPVTVTVSSSTSPWYVVFNESVNNDTLVTSYRLDVFHSGADPSTAAPVASSDLGRPTASSTGEMKIDRTTFFKALAAGNYIATVSAVGSGGEGRSAPASFTR